MAKKILYIANFIFQGNHSFFKSSMQAAKELGYEFHLAANFNHVTEKERKSYEERYGIQTHQVDFKESPLHPANLKTFVQLRNIIQAESIEKVHCNTPVGGVYGRLAAKSCGIKDIIYQAHGFHFYKGAPKLVWLLFYPIEKCLSRLTSTLVTINQEDYQLAKRKFRSSRVELVNGVGFEKQVTQDKCTIKAFKQELGLREDACICLSLGQLNDNKNHLTLLKAIKELGTLDIQYLIAGEGEQEQTLLNYIHTNHLEERVKLLGYRSDVHDLLAIADVFCLPSKREGLSVALMEAMAASLPCIVSDIRGNQDLVDEQKGGYLVPTLDAKAYAEALKRVARDAALRKEMGAYNQEKVKQFSFSKVKEQMKRVYAQEEEANNE
ncbi:Glycosyltransferase [Streptococcus sp. DD10]|uniref:glycosyltransferase family 4 protein n=1 Tax=Streptococcus sp. DD10 TaxID=1777878 RepID=UPI00079C8D60|nr:glycosyltransferase family 4 protein [Streptococcus sp. DD10]KXT76140.1 Glycosyltransferase [Streptococcus sp. DD10]